MNISISLRDGISADVAQKIAAIKNKKPILHAMSRTLINLARRSWDEPELRPLGWPERKKDTGKPILISTTSLRRSLRTLQVTNESATVGTDRPYAAVHQFGSRSKKGRGGGIPPRPYWPVTGGTANPKLTAKAEEAINAAAERAADAQLGIS